jgi:hypothetical protein
MIKIFKTVVVLLVFVVSIYAKDSLAVDDIEIDDTKQSSGFLKYMQKSFSGEIGATYYDGETDIRKGYVGVLRYEDTFFDFIKTKIEYQLSKTVITKELELSGLYSSDINQTRPLEKTVTKTFNDNTFREAYISMDLGDYVLEDR